MSSGGPLDFGDDRPARPVPPPAPTSGAGVEAGGDGAPAPPPRARLRDRRPRGPVWFVGAVGLVLIIIVSVSTFRSGGKPPGLERGQLLPGFAAPLAFSRFDTERDAVDLGDGDRARACRLHGAGVLNGCDLVARTPAVIAFFAVSSPDCIKQIDQLDDLRTRYPGVRFAAVAIRAQRTTTAKVARARRWTLPVAYDRDGRLASAMRVVTCPQISFLRRGGASARTSFDRLSAPELRALVEQLRRGT